MDVDGDLFAALHVWPLPSQVEVGQVIELVRYQALIAISTAPTAIKPMPIRPIAEGRSPRQGRRVWSRFLRWVRTELAGLGSSTALSLLEQTFRDLMSPIAFVRAGGFFENFLYGLQVSQGGISSLVRAAEDDAAAIHGHQRLCLAH